jgi:hypothetical protein
MKKRKPILKIIVWGVIFVLISNGIRLYFVNKYYGYHRINSIKKPKEFSIFKDTVINKFNIELDLKNGLNDTLYFLTYEDKYLFIFWKIYQYNHLPLDYFKKTNWFQSKRQYFKDYLTIAHPNNPIMSVIQKKKLPVKDSIFFSFSGNYSDFKKIENKKYLLYNLNSTGIKFFSNKKYSDISIGRYTNERSNFLITKSHDSFCLIYMVSLKERDLTLDDLLKLLSPRFLSENKLKI